MENTAPKVENGLGEALGLNMVPGIGGGISPQSFIGAPGFPGSGGGEAISGVQTIFKNLRWYLITNFRQALANAYAEMGLVQAIVDVPVDDALRGGIEIKTLQLDEDQIEELRVSIESGGDLTTFGQAAKWTRLFGGGATILMVPGQDPATPLKLSSIPEGVNVRLRAADLWELSCNDDGDVPVDGDYLEDKGADLGELSDFDRTETFNYYGVTIHKSRVLRMKGKEAPSYIRSRLRGWGLSVVEGPVRSLNQYLKATDLSFEVLDEFKLDVYKFKNLVNTLLGPNGEQAVAKRVAIANSNKNYNNAVVLDADDEFDNKQLSFAGLAEVMTGIKVQIAADLRMPLTKLFGISAQGFNSGQDDIEVYNAMVESSVRTPMKSDLLKLVKIKCQTMFGFVPDDLSITFKPLRVLSALDEESVKTQKFSRILQAKQAGELTAAEFRDACNRDTLLGITLDVDEGSLAELEAENEPPEQFGGGDDVDDEETDDEPNEDVDEKPSLMNRLFGRKRNAAEDVSSVRGRKGKQLALGAPDSRETRKAPDARKANEFDESKHSRADDGKFGKGSGTGGAKGQKAKKAKSDKVRREPGSETPTAKAAGKMQKGDTVKLGDYTFKFRSETVLPEGTRKRTGQVSASAWNLTDDSGEQIGVFHLRTFDAPEPLGQFTMVDTADIEGDHKGKGLGTKAYALMAEHYGTLLSDNRSTSEAATRVWEKLGAEPATKYADELKAAGDSAEKIDGTPRWILTRDNLKKKNSLTYQKVANALGLDQPITTTTAKSKKKVRAKYYTVDGIHYFPRAWNLMERTKRTLNSATFDRKSYEADGGDAWVDPRRAEFFKQMPLGGSAMIWAKAEQASRDAFNGELRWQFVVWIYRKLGGAF